MSIEKLPHHYSYSSPFTVHDEESGTVLELLGRHGGKINEVVNDQNKLRQETEDHLEKQDSYNEETRTKTVPAEVKKEVQRQIDNGTFDEQMEEHIGNLEDRVDNLLGTVTEGTSTMDAEIIDLRTDIFGNGTGYHANAGESVRFQFENIPKSYNGDVKILHGASKGEIKTAKNFKWIRAYGVDISKYKIACVFNDETYPYRVMFKGNTEEGVSDLICDMDGSNPYFLQLSNGYIHFDYDWSSHDYNVNLTYSGSSLMISESALSTKYVEQRLVQIESDIDVMEGLVNYTPGEALTESSRHPTMYIQEKTDAPGIGHFGSLNASYTEFAVVGYPVKKGVKYLLHGEVKLAAAYPIAGFNDQTDPRYNLELIAYNNGTVQSYDVTFTPPYNGTLWIAKYGETELKPYIAVPTSVKDTAEASVHGCVGNPWSGKKVVWLGTSVSFGQLATKSYPQEASKNLNFELVNASVPGLAIHTNADGSIKTYGSLCLSIAESEAQGLDIPDSPVAYSPGGSYNNYYRTYENIFCEENSDADLFVFAVTPNNSDYGTSDWDKFDFDSWQYTDGSTFESHRSTFLGAILFLMDKMYACNPNARMCFVLDSAFNYNSGKTAFELIKNKWNIPVIDLWGKINLSPKSYVKLKAKDGTDSHPSTLAHEVMGRMMTGEMLLIG